MARGDSDFLFDIPKIKKPAKKQFPQQNFAKAISSLFFLNGTTYTQDVEGNITLLDENMKPTKVSSFPRLEKDGLLFASKAGVVFGDHQGFAIHSLSGDKNSIRPQASFLKNPPPGKALHLHLTKHTLYCLCQDSNGEKILAKTYLDTASKGWSVVHRFRRNQKVEFQNNGDRSVMLVNEGMFREAEFLIFDEEGANEKLTLKADTFLTTPQAQLIAPVEKNACFALERGKHGDEITLFSATHLKSETKRIRIVSLIGRGLENEWKDLTSHRKRGALLGSDSIILFSTEGPGSMQEISLDPIDRGFGRISLNEDHILLWQPGSSAYRKIPLLEALSQKEKS